MAKVMVTKSRGDEVAAFISHNKSDKDPARSCYLAPRGTRCGRVVQMSGNCGQAIL